MILFGFSTLAFSQQNVVFIDRPIKLAPPPKPSNSLIDSIKDLVTTEDSTTTVEIPVETEDGTPLVVVLEESEDGTSTITVPGHGEVDVVQDGDNTVITIPGQGEVNIINNGDGGGFDFEVTPEGIENAENITCKIKGSKKGSCTIEPFTTVVGSKVLTADKFVLDYEKGENLKVISGNATNVQLTDDDEVTQYGPETNLGDAAVSLSMNSNTNNNSLSPIPTPDEFKNADQLEFSVETTRMVHLVPDPNNPGQKLTQFEVKEDKGIVASIKIEDDKTLTTASTKSGILYDSNPGEPSDGVTVDSDAPIHFQFATDSSLETPQSSLSFVMDGKNSSGEQSEVVIEEKGDGKESTKFVANGRTGINIKQSFQQGTNPNEPKVDLDLPASIEVFSEKLEVTETNSKGEVSSSTKAEGLIASADRNPQEGRTQVRVNADSLSNTTLKNNKVNTQAIISGNVGLLLRETPERNDLMFNSDFAHYSNSDVSGEATGGIFYNGTQYKDISKAPVVDGKKVENEHFISGDKVTFTEKSTGNTAQLEDGFSLNIREFENGDDQVQFAGTKGNITTDDNAVAINSPVYITMDKSKANKTEEVTFQALDLGVTDKKSGDKLTLNNSVTYIGRDESGGKGKEILKIQNKSDNITYKTGDGENLASVKDLELSATKDGKVQYGQASFKEGLFLSDIKDGSKGKENPGESDFKNKVKLLNTQVVYFVDDSAPGKEIRSGLLSSEKMSSSNLDYSVDIEVLNDSNQPEQFKVFFYQEGPVKSFKIFNENGKLVQLSGLDKDGNKFKFLTESISYFEDPEFKQFVGKEVQGNIETVDANDKRIVDFHIGEVSGIQSIDGDFMQLQITDGQVSEQNLTDGTSTFADVSTFNYTKQDNIQVGNVELKEMKYLSDIDPSSGVAGQQVQVLNTSIAFNIDETDPNRVIKNGVVVSENIKFSDPEYSVEVKIKDAKPGEDRFKLVFYEDGNTKYFKAFKDNPNGQPIEISGNDLENNYSVLFDSIEYFQSDDYKQFAGENISGKLESVGGDDKSVQLFSMDSIRGIQQGDTTAVEINNASITNIDSNGTVGATASQVNVQSQTNIKNGDYVDITQLEAFDGKINFQNLKDGSPQLNSSITFGTAMAQQLTKEDGETVSVFQANDISVVAIDITNDTKFSGDVGSVSMFNDKNINFVDVKDIQNFTYEDIKSGAVAVVNGDQVTVVVDKDDQGNVKSSYLLVDNSVLNYTDEANAIDAEIKVGVLEVLQDKLSGQNIILKADVQGEVNYTEGIGGKLKFGLKGEKLVFDSNSYTSEDGKFLSNSVEIRALEGGRLDNVTLEAGPSFLEDFISIKASGGKDGGRALRFSFQQDKAMGTYYLKAEFKEGDKVKIKLFPFTLESKKEGDDAVAELMMTVKGQNYMNHMEIISSVANMEEITDWLSVGDDSIAVRGNITKNTAIEVFYSKEDLWGVLPVAGLNSNMGNGAKAESYGIALVRKKGEGVENTYGVLLSGDSEIEYKTNGEGVLKFMGQDMDKNGRIPMTANIFFKRKTKTGDVHLLDLGYSATKHLIGEDLISPDAAFFDEGRQMGGGSLTYTYSTKPSENSNLSFSVGAYNDFSEPVAQVQYSYRFGGSSKKSKRRKTKRSPSNIQLAPRAYRDLSPPSTSNCNPGTFSDYRLLSGLSRNTGNIIGTADAYKVKPKVATYEERLAEYKKQVEHLNKVLPGWIVAYKIEEKIKEITEDAEKLNDDADFIISNPEDLRIAFGLSEKEVKDYNLMLSHTKHNELNKPFDTFSMQADLASSSLTVGKKIESILSFHNKQIQGAKKHYSFDDLSQLKKKCEGYAKKHKDLSIFGGNPKCLTDS